MGRILSFVSVLALLFGFAACASDGAGSEAFSAESKIGGDALDSAASLFSDSLSDEMKTKLRITVKERAFEAELYKNETAQAFAAMLPLTLEMSAMLHEKYCYLPSRLPSAAQSVAQIRAGELMLWENACLVLFYESFSSSYSYTPVGRIADCEGLAEALGDGGVTISFAFAE